MKRSTTDTRPRESGSAGTVVMRRWDARRGSPGVRSTGRSKLTKLGEKVDGPMDAFFTDETVLSESLLFAGDSVNSEDRYD